MPSPNASLLAPAIRGIFNLKCFSDNNLIIRQIEQNSSHPPTLSQQLNSALSVSFSVDGLLWNSSGDLLGFEGVRTRRPS